MAFKALHVKPDGTQREVEISRIRDIQALLGGAYFELVRCRDGFMFVDDEGVIKGLPQNAFGRERYYGPTGIAGDIVFMTRETFHAFDAGLEG